jgi:hypothetical protein
VEAFRSGFDGEAWVIGSFTADHPGRVVVVA